MKRATEDSCLRIMASPLYHNTILPIRNQYFGRRRQNPETNPVILLLYCFEYCLTKNLDIDSDLSLFIEIIKLTIIFL